MQKCKYYLIYCKQCNDPNQVNCKCKVKIIKSNVNKYEAKNTYFCMECRKSINYYATMCNECKESPYRKCYRCNMTCYVDNPNKYFHECDTCKSKKCKSCHEYKDNLDDGYCQKCKPIKCLFCENIASKGYMICSSHYGECKYCGRNSYNAYWNNGESKVMRNIFCLECNHQHGNTCSTMIPYECTDEWNHRAVGYYKCRCTNEYTHWYPECNHKIIDLYDYKRN